jgi:hypothetical protein
LIYNCLLFLNNRFFPIFPAYSHTIRHKFGTQNCMNIHITKRLSRDKQKPIIPLNGVRQVDNAYPQVYLLTQSQKIRFKEIIIKKR